MLAFGCAWTGGECLSRGEASGAYRAPQIVFPLDPSYALVPVRQDLPAEETRSQPPRRAPDRHVTVSFRGSRRLHQRRLRPEDSRGYESAARQHPETRRACNLEGKAGHRQRIDDVLFEKVTEATRD